MCCPLPPFAPTFIRMEATYDYLKYWIAITGCPNLTQCHSILRHWWMGSEGHLLPFLCRILKCTSYFEDCTSLVRMLLLRLIWEPGLYLRTFFLQLASKTFLLFSFSLGLINPFISDAVFIFSHFRSVSCCLFVSQSSELAFDYNRVSKKACCKK